MSQTPEEQMVLDVSGLISGYIPRVMVRMIKRTAFATAISLISQKYVEAKIQEERSSNEKDFNPIDLVHS